MLRELEDNDFFSKERKRGKWIKDVMCGKLKVTCYCKLKMENKVNKNPSLKTICLFTMYLNG